MRPVTFPDSVRCASFASTLLGVLVAVLAMSCAGSASLMTWDQYQRSPHRWPYVVQASAKAANLYYFGAQHTNDPDDAQIAQLEAAWNRLRPIVAFNEGGDPAVVPTREEEIRQFGEAGFVRWLGQRDGVPVQSLDLSRLQQAQTLLTRYSAVEVKTFLLQRALLPCEDRTDCDQEGELNRILPIVESTSGLASAPHDWREFRDSLKGFARADVGNHRDWFDPTKDGHAFNEMTRLVEDARDHHMIVTLLDAMHGAERVFAVAGGSHVVRQERALRARIRK